MGLLLSLDGGMNPIACHMSYLVIKLEFVNIFEKKTCQTRPKAIKHLKNTKMSQEDCIKRIKHYYIERVLHEDTKFSSLSQSHPFL